MKNFIIAAVAVTAITFASTNMAEARSKVRFSFGGNGWNVSVGGHSNHSGHSSHSNHGRNNFRTSYNSHNNHGHNSHSNSYYPTIYRPAHTWHDTSHYDYRPATLRRHGNHYDYQPARYEFHRTGHVDHNHH